MFEIIPSNERIKIKKSHGKLSTEEIKKLLMDLASYGVKVNFNSIRNFSLKEDADEMTLKIEKIQITISADEMEAYVKLNSKDITFNEIIESIEKEGICYGILENEIKSALTEGKEKFPIAKGKEPKNGKDGYLIFHVELPNKKVRENSKEGKIDFYNLDIFKFVKKDQVLAEIIPPTPGEDGMTVLGRKIKATLGKKATYTLDKNTFIDGNYIKSKIDGVFSFEEGKFTVSPVLLIDGDVDLSTGNINSDITVQIMGWVRNGFKISSKKDIIIEGGVEKDVVLNAQGSIVIKGGVFGGPKSEIFCKKNLYSKFLQDLKAVVEGDIYVNDYVINCNIQSNGSLFLSTNNGKLINTNISLKYAAYVKELIGGKKKIKIKGFSRKELLKLINSYMNEKTKLKKIMVDWSLKIKNNVLEIAKLKAEGDDFTHLVIEQQRLSNGYKRMLETYSKLEDKINQIKEILLHVKGEGAIYILNKAVDLKTTLKTVPLEITEIKNSVIYIDENEEVKKE
ncbi:hypothetical protein SU69_03395 [Thermosipho melanesiensis]|uniref:Flagellar Assembly Protein A N-terminal region domain-containing protein n=2 Tax=Thermosipho melanesiensis TaxID=46541 RepID=A6LKS0_THEM4|nr:FapA family protein [Thermosipho melanesiensis]ABR30521.1 protein of unknown function DUF342 [Thermosipho melanesiensis BI429]APT74839.1 hypothetical protein BW47_03575 [Thermosipho melanesiensis]OOC35612.1 hypothetical protein SU68_03450 [Thermosipho melanesiensis]OOC39286.1 hypothetical protein SU69_03395 [Thermosipho melanesiensis]OOC39372.1 hypothetical protein SU70_03395 [Thermosipho melanesiensis]